MLEELKANSDDFCFICKSKKDMCTSTSFRLLANGLAKCELCGTIYGYVEMLDGWVKIAAPKKKRTRKKAPNKKDEDSD